MTTKDESKAEWQAQRLAIAAEAQHIFKTVSYPNFFLMVKNGQIPYDVFVAVLDKIFDAGWDQAKQSTQEEN